MKRILTTLGTFGLLATVAATPAHVQSYTGVPLHVNTAYNRCFFDLHPELTTAQFEEFAGELGSILRFRQLGDTPTLGKGRFDVGLQYTMTPINDQKGAWNNTFSHPTADHPLGDLIEFPRIVARFGVSDRVDVGGWGGIAPGSNWGIVGFDTRVALVREDADHPVSVSIRPSIGALVGPSEVFASSASVDLSVGRTFGRWSPYVGLAATTAVAIERSSDVDFGPATNGDSLAFAGVSYGWRRLLLSAEVEKGDLFSYGFRIGTRF
jgi:hypothetical protein